MEGTGQAETGQDSSEGEEKRKRGREECISVLKAH